MSRHGSRRSDRVQPERPAPPAESVVRAAAEPEAAPAAAPPARVHWTWKLTAVLFASAFVLLLLDEWISTIYRMMQ